LSLILKNYNILYIYFNLACLECISNEFANGHLKCTFCNKINLIGDLKDLKSNENVIDQINLRSNDITIEIEEKLKKFANESKGQYF